MMESGGEKKIAREENTTLFHTLAWIGLIPHTMASGARGPRMALIAVLILALALACRAKSGSGVGKLQVGVKRRAPPEDCLLEVRPGDAVAVHFTVRLSDLAEHINEQETRCDCAITR